MAQRLALLLTSYLSQQNQRNIHTLCRKCSPFRSIEALSRVVNTTVVSTSLNHGNARTQCLLSRCASSAVSLIGQCQGGTYLSNTNWRNPCSNSNTFSVNVRMDTSNSLPVGKWSLRWYCRELPENIHNRETPGSSNAEESSAETSATIAKVLIAEVSKKDKMILSVPERKIKNVIQTLLNTELTPQEAQDVLISNPEIIMFGKLQQSLSLLAGYGFTSSDVYRVLLGVENIAKLKASEIEKVFDVLRTIGMKEDKMKDLVIKEPRVLSLDGRNIETRMSHLKAYFKTDDVLRVVNKTPFVLICSLEDLIRKFDYAHHEMHASQRQIMYTDLFAYPLFHLKCRHQFLVLAGLYTTEKALRASNPRLQDVIDSSDSNFVKKFGGMHVDEYTTFCKMMAKSEQFDED